MLNCRIIIFYVKIASMLVFHRTTLSQNYFIGLKRLMLCVCVHVHFYLN